MAFNFLFSLLVYFNSWFCKVSVFLSKFCYVFSFTFEHITMQIIILVQTMNMETWKTYCCSVISSCGCAVTYVKNKGEEVIPCPKLTWCCCSCFVQCLSHLHHCPLLHNPYISWWGAVIGWLAPVLGPQYKRHLCQSEWLNELLTFRWSPYGGRPLGERRKSGWSPCSSDANFKYSRLKSFGAGVSFSPDTESLMMRTPFAATHLIMSGQRII